MDTIPSNPLESRRASLAASRRGEQDRMLQLARENARLSEENAQLRRRSQDLAASAEMWIQLYEAALARANERPGRGSE